MARELQPGERQVKRLQEIGNWLNSYGESIYKTRGGPILNGMWGGITNPRNKLLIRYLSLNTIKM